MEKLVPLSHAHFEVQLTHPFSDIYNLLKYMGECIYVRICLYMEHEIMVWRAESIGT